MMTKNDIITAYYSEGGFTLECEPEVKHWTEAAMNRRAHALGYTHVKTVHGQYDKATKRFFFHPDIKPDTRRIPKMYRKGA